MNSVAYVRKGGVQWIEIDQGQRGQHVNGVARQAVEQTLNELLDAEDDAPCGAEKYERSRASRPGTSGASRSRR
jgi:hypothetical protein